MLTFSDMTDDCARNERAYRICDTQLQRTLHKFDIYGKLTYNQACQSHWESMDEVVMALRVNPGLANLPQGVDEWLMRLRMELRMETAISTYRK